MKEKIISTLIIAALGIIIGYLVYPAINKTDPPAAPPTTEDDLIGPVVPDTVFQIDAASAKELRQAYNKIRKLYSHINYLNKNPEVAIKEVEREKKKELKDLPLFESRKDFAFKNMGTDQNDSAFVYGTVWAYSPLPVEAFTASMVVRWSDYYDINLTPVWEKKLAYTRKVSTLKGLSAGIVAASGIAAAFAFDNPYIAIGGLAGGGFIILYF